MFLFIIAEANGRQLPTPVTIRDSREFHTSSDYESIPSFEASIVGSEQGENKHLFRVQNSNIFHILDDFVSSHASCHDYESISSLDYGHKFADLKSEDVDVVHGYARIPIKNDIEEENSPCKLPSDTHLSAAGKRNKLMKIDSHGYASVLPPEVEDGSRGIDCLHQDNRQSNTMGTSTFSSKGHRVRDTEEAWKHQQARGYAPLTLKTQPPTPPPLLIRTSSDGILCNSLSLVAPGSTPRDYEVPIPRLSLPPPLAITKRKSSSPLMRHRAVFSPTTEHRTFISEAESVSEPRTVTLKDSDRQKRLKDVDGCVDPNFLDTDTEKDHHRRKHSAPNATGPAPNENPLQYNSQ